MGREINKEFIEKQAKDILDKFAGSLSRVEKEAGEEGIVEREVFERVEKDGEKEDKDFRKKVLENAPVHDEDFIIAEKGSWK
jgi:Asp-tRNA(Asn)/Glu-tRNA(Gln) amidotransferase C subunit